VTPEELPEKRSKRETIWWRGVDEQYRPATGAVRRARQGVPFEREKRGHLPTLEVVSIYSVLAKYNNYQQFFNAFQRNNFNAGVNVQVPIFSARVKAAVGWRRSIWMPRGRSLAARNPK